MYKNIKAIALLLLLFVITASALPEQKVTVYLIGDSTMCLYPSSRAPLTGWGMPFANFFDSTVVIKNLAKGGRSTKTFLSENRWKPVADSLRSGDYVFIQFGHNDEAKEPKYAERYTPIEDYKKNLVRFIIDTRNKKAYPILITPVTRMKFDDKGRMMETHTEYTNAVYIVAKQYKVPIIDLDKKSRDLLQQLGPQNAKLLFMQLQPGENPIYPDGQKDNTHFNDYGARRIAQLVLQELMLLHLDLENRIIKQKK